jgi:hypothetical protein
MTTGLFGRIHDAIERSVFLCVKENTALLVADCDNIRIVVQASM